MKQKKAPYADTEVPADKSRMKITELLRDYGAEGVQWSEVFSQNLTEVRFVLKHPSGRYVTVKVRPPAFGVTRKTWDAEKGRYELVVLPNWAQSYRLLYHYLKSKLEAVAYGLRDIEEEFLSDIVVRSQTGEETTVGEALRPSLAAGTFRPMLPTAEPTTNAPELARDATYEVRT